MDSREQQLFLEREAQKLADVLQQRRQCRFMNIFPDCGPTCDSASLDPSDHAGLCRTLYRRHVDIMNAGAQYTERLFLCANQVGKSRAGAFEVTCHLTGLYPHWWQGRRFDGPTEWWLAGDTMLTTRNILQVEMLGSVDTLDSKQWSGMLPPWTVHHVSRKAGGVTGCADTMWVKHVSGKMSTAQFLSYDQGRKVFQGVPRDGIWLDEEPPDASNIDQGESGDIYSECLLRTVTRNGIILATFTPLRGMTPFLDRYIDDAKMFDASGDPVPARNILFGSEEAA